MKISASTNPPVLEDLNGYILKLNDANVDYIHCDVMDGKFVKAKTFGPSKVLEINKLTDKTLDVHLMVKHPTCKLKKYIKAGADILTVHYEAYKNKKKLIRDLQKIKECGAFAGLSFNPDTSALDILPYIYYVDMLLVMSVVPGKSGQEFLPETLIKLDIINKFLKVQKLEVVVEVDGGVNDKNISLLLEKQVDSVVMGNYLFRAENLAKAVDNVKSMAEVNSKSQNKKTISKSTKKDSTAKKTVKKASKNK